MADGSKTYLSLAAIGKRLGLSKEGIRKAATRNHLTPVNGRFALEDVAAALRSEQSEKLNDAKTTAATSVLKQKLLLVKIEAAELELKKANAAVVPVTEVRNELGRLITNAKTVLLSLPSSLAPAVVGLSVPDAERLLRERIHDSLNQLSEGRFEPTPQ